MYQVKFSQRAEKEIKKLPKPIAKKIVESISLLATNPFAEVLRFKKLRTQANLYRIRVGDYRVIYEIKGDLLLVIVVRIGHRKDVYRYLLDA